MNGVGLLLVGRDVFERRMVKRCAVMFLISALTVVVAQVTRPLGALTSVMTAFATLGVLVLLLRVIRPEEWAVARSGIGRVQARVMRRGQTREGVGLTKAE